MQCLTSTAKTSAKLVLLLSLPHCPLAVSHLSTCLIGRSGRGVSLITISPVLSTVTLMLPTPLHRCWEWRWRWWPWEERKAEGFSLAGQRSSVNDEKRPLGILDHPGTSGDQEEIHPVFTPVLSKNYNYKHNRVGSTRTTHVIIIELVQVSDFFSIKILEMCT